MPIAFDAATDGGTLTGPAATFAHTCSGADRALLVGIAGEQDADTVTGVTYDGVAMALVEKLVNNALDRTLYVFLLMNPASGSHTVEIASGSHALFAGAVSYTGCKQSGQPDESTTNISTGTPTSLTTSLTTMADNCWSIVFEGAYNANNEPGAGTGSTKREADGTFGVWGFFDSAAAITPAGSYSMTTTRTSTPSAEIGHIMLSLAPATSGTTLTAGANGVTVTAPAATIAPGTATVSAGVQGITITAPAATLVPETVTLNAGAQGISVVVPLATVLGVDQLLAAGANGITVVAPTATIFAPGLGDPPMLRRGGGILGAGGRGSTITPGSVRRAN